MNWNQHEYEYEWILQDYYLRYDDGVAAMMYSKYDDGVDALMYSISNPVTVDQQVAAEIEKRRKAAELEQKLALVDTYGEDTLPDGSILSFDKQYKAGETIYNYAALKTNDQWYLTGSLNGFMRGTWDKFVLALISGDFPVDPGNIEVVGSGATLREPARDWSDAKTVAATQIIPRHVGTAATTPMDREPYLD